MDAVFVLHTLILSRISNNQRLYVLFVDLRTAFPSLSRPILIQRLVQCGLGLGICHLVSAIFRVTWSIVYLGKVLGKPFLEKLGVREGSVESPVLFSIYISELRHRLEAAHPRLCRMGHIIIAILLYADDAALPADTAEDLDLSVQILESFCNEMRLYISVDKTKLTVFHASNDPSVIYQHGKGFC